MKSTVAISENITLVAVDSVPRKPGQTNTMSKRFYDLARPEVAKTIDHDGNGKVTFGLVGRAGLRLTKHDQNRDYGLLGNNDGFGWLLARTMPL